MLIKILINLLYINTIFRTIVARRVCLLIGLHYFYRSVTFFITVLPKPDAKFHCAPQLNDTSVLIILQRFAKLAVGFGLTINGNYVYCGDYIYSGHTMMLVTCYLIIQGKNQIYHFEIQEMLIIRNLNFIDV